jgi:uncharacterized protein YgbK (DUF1537 family)
MESIHAHEVVRRGFAIVADDLTGACDSAVAFTQRGKTVEVLLEEGAEPSFDEVVWAISTESRDLPAEVAAKRVEVALSRASRTGEVFKKVDSVFRGNTFVEIRAALDCFSYDLAVLSPAYPAMGRTVRDGVLQVSEAGSKRSINLCAELHEAGVNDIAHSSGAASRRSLRNVVEAGHRLVLCDAELDADLISTVEEARESAQRVLWIGSGGLAHALASQLPRVEPPQKDCGIEGVVVLFVGSDHAVTQRQIEILKVSIAVSVLETSIEDFSGVLSDSRVVILNVSRLTSEDRVGRVVSRLASHGIACCLMTGGDTAALVCRASGAHSLQLTEEFSPGLPQGVIQGGTLDQLPVVLKSGGFGKEDVLREFVDRFVTKKELV